MVERRFDMKDIKSITPNPPADFAPTISEVPALEPFRYWCQKVLPLVYDDSLSYYELLCKVAQYVNKCIEGLDATASNVQNLYKAYTQLQEWVNHYFDSLDVQQEINKKLDAMFASGVFDVIISNYFKDTAIVFENVAEMKSSDKLHIGSTAITLGYYKAGDNGGSIFNIIKPPLENSQNLIGINIKNGLFAELTPIGYLSPEMFGAHGDNSHDDSVALNNMIVALKNISPLIDLGESGSFKNLSNLKLQFNGIYLVEKPVFITNTYGLIIDGLTIIAGENFIGKSVIEFNDGSFYNTVKNSTIDANFKCSDCVFINSYSLYNKINNSIITNFVENGIETLDNLGARVHEVTISDCKIHQFYYGNRNIHPEIKTGIGINFSKSTFDCVTINNTISDCRKFAISDKGGNKHIASHFYGCDNYCESNTKFSNCYFDGSTLYVKGNFYLLNCELLHDNKNNAIICNDAGEQNFLYSECIIEGNIFKFSKGTNSTNKAISASKTIMDLINNCGCSSNVFSRCKSFSPVGGLTTAPNNGSMLPSSIKPNYVTFGTLAFVQGEVSSNGLVNFPEGAPEFYNLLGIMFDKSGVSFSDFNYTNFNVSGVTGPTKWFAIGRTWLGD